MAELKKRQPLEVVEHWLHVIETEGRRVTDWERHFCESIQSQLDEERGLSEVQEDKLESIYANRTA